MWNARRIEIGQNGQNGQNGHSLIPEGDLVPTQSKCLLKCLCRCSTSHNSLSIILVRLRFVWNAHRFEIGQNGQNGQNGHSLESEGDFVFTQMSCFLTHLVSVKAYAYVPLHKPISYYTALIFGYG